MDTNGGGAASCLSHGMGNNTFRGDIQTSNKGEGGDGGFMELGYWYPGGDGGSPYLFIGY